MQLVTHLASHHPYHRPRMRSVSGGRMESVQVLKEKVLTLLCNYIQEITGSCILPNEYYLIEQAVKVKTIRRRQYLLQEGDICRHLSFVANGALRMYSVNERGQESIVSLSLENNWIADRESMGLQTPSIYNIEAVENSEIIQFTPGQLDILNQTIPAFNEMTRNQNRQMAIATQKRIHVAISMTAEEKYHDLQSCYPEYVQRFSQNMIASYLGIKPETLSRIRKR